MDRSEFLKLCERLGSPDDREVLETARAITAELEKSGMTWDEALAPDETPASATPEDVADANLPDDDPEAPAETPAVPPAMDEDPAETAAANARSLALIEKLLARGDLSEELREDLESYKDDIKSGSLDRADRAYLEFLADRLGKAK